MYTKLSRATHGLMILSLSLFLFNACKDNITADSDDPDPDMDPEIEIVLSTIAAGRNHACALDVDGQAYCWGNNEAGQLGDGTRIQRLTPVAVSTPAGVSFTSIAAGIHTLALSSDGQVWAWGINETGQLGDGTRTDRLTPVAVSMPTGVSFTSIAVGIRHSLALATDGQVWAWGFNNEGQLGDGTTTLRLTPVEASMPTGVIIRTIATNGPHSLALSEDGQGWAWGRNDNGQLGDGTTIARLTPVAISMPAGMSFSSISAGSNHSLALSADGQGWAWGANGFGTLGDGTTTNKFVPVAVSMPAALNFSSIAAGSSHSLALSTDGKMWAWGRNDSGQLGDGTTTQKLTPVAVSMPAGVSIRTSATYDSHSLIQATNGNLLAWGRNDSGQLGDGTTDDRLTPVTLIWQ